MKPDQAVYYLPNSSHIMDRISNVDCADGRSRTATLDRNGPDTFFSVPARVKARGRTVTGYVTLDNGRYRFHAYRHRKNWEAVEPPEPEDTPEADALATDSVMKAVRGR